MGNVTYTGWGGVTLRAFDALSRTGGLQPRVPEPAPALVEMRAAVSQLVQRWDEGVADRIAAENLYLDESKDRRRRALEELRTKAGACSPDAAFDVENALRGQWTMNCERGKLRVAITLAPTSPPRVQYLSVREVQANEPGRAPTCVQ
jgi:hypothetical protein